MSSPIKSDLIDCITFEPIEPCNHIKTQSGVFDVETLYRYYHDNHLEVPQDPFNRQPLSPEVAQRVLAYSNTQLLDIEIACASGELITLKVNKYTNIGSIVCRAITEVQDMRESIVCDFVFHLDGQDKSAYDMDLNSCLPLSQGTTFSVFQYQNSELSVDRIVSKLGPYASERRYDADANYLAISHYCVGYAMRTINHRLLDMTSLRILAQQGVGLDFDGDVAVVSSYAFPRNAPFPWDDDSDEVPDSVHSDDY